MTKKISLSTFANRCWMEGNPTTLRPILYTHEPIPRFILLRCVGLTLGYCSVRCYDVKLAVETYSGIKQN